MKLRYKNLTVEVPNSMDEITFGKWLEWSREAEELSKIEADTFEAQLKLFRICEILCGVEEGGLDDLEIEETTELIKIVTQIVNTKTEYTPSEAFQIDGKWYATRNLTGMNKITNGEYISLKTLAKEYEGNQWAYFPLVVAILIRPAKKVIDTETGREIWELEKFSLRDIENLEWRAELFKQKALAKDIAPVVSFFLSLTEKSITNTETSLEQEPQLTKKETPL